MLLYVLVCGQELVFVIPTFTPSNHVVSVIMAVSKYGSDAYIKSKLDAPNEDHLPAARKVFTLNE